MIEVTFRLLLERLGCHRRFGELKQRAMFLEIVLFAGVRMVLNVLCFVHVGPRCASVNASAAMWLKLSLQPRPLLASPST